MFAVFYGAATALRFSARERLECRLFTDSERVRSEIFATNLQLTAQSHKPASQDQSDSIFELHAINSRAVVCSTRGGNLTCGGLYQQDCSNQNETAVNKQEKLMNCYAAVNRPPKERCEYHKRQ